MTQETKAQEGMVPDNAQLTEEANASNALLREAGNASAASAFRMNDALGAGAGTGTTPSVLSAADIAADLAESGARFEKSLTRVVHLSQTVADTLGSVKLDTQPLDKLLAEFQTYEQSRNKVTKEYADKRKSLYESDGKTLRKGVTQGNVDELDRKESDALNAVDTQFAQREDTYQAWMNQIANMTLDGLETTLAEAKSSLAEIEASGEGGSKAAEARARVTAAKKKVSEAHAKQEMTPGIRTVKEWKDLSKALEEAQKEFKAIGESVDGMAGEIIGAAGTVLFSTQDMINGITQLADWSSISAQKSAEGVSKAIQGVEKASVLLSVISAAASIAKSIIGLFNHDEQKQKEIEKLQRRIDQLQWEIDNADIVRLQHNTESALSRVKRVYAETAQEVLQLHASTNRYAGTLDQFVGRAALKNEMLRLSAEKLAAEYANMGYSVDKALGMDKYDDARVKLGKMAEQQLLIQEQIQREDAKKKSDRGKIQAFKQQIEEIGAASVAIINDLVEDIVGGSATDLAGQLGDAFFDAFRAGEDAAEAWGNKVNDIVAGIVKRMLVQELLEKPLGTLFDEYKEKWFKDDTFLGFENVTDSMPGFAEKLNALIAGFQNGVDGMPEELKGMLFPGAGTGAPEASERGIATASQQSVDELNGRATAIQGHTYSIMESTRQLVADSALILMHLAGIETNTRQLTRLAAIERDMKAVKSTVGDIALKGIKLKA